jgi:hypothetical protein
MDLDLERLAREAGLRDDEYASYPVTTAWTGRTSDLSRFAALVLEEAAKAVEDADAPDESGHYYARAIRALKPAASPPRP